MIRILNAEPLNYCDQARAILRSIGELHEQRLTREQLISTLKDFDVLIIRLGIQVDRELIHAAPRLKVIMTATTGLDHIDLASAAERSITVLSLKGENKFLRSIPATAEHTWALLLALVRRIPQAWNSVRSGEWNRDAFRGHDLCGKRLGIAGLGRVGKKVARYGLAFEMDVAAYDPFRKDWVPKVYRCSSFHDLLSRSDVLSLHVPLDAQTGQMMKAREFNLLPMGAVVINTSRGEILDEGALMDALEKGHLAGAALDVICDERDDARRRRSRLLQYAREHVHLIITPHIGGATAESMAQTEIFMAEKLKTFLSSAAG